MSKVKSTTKPAKASKSDALSKVKDAAVSKPAQSIKSKSKDMAKQIVTKEEKKSKKSKKVKEPTPEPESESESSESSSNEEESEEESEEEIKPVKSKTNGVHKAAESSDESEDDSSEDEAPANGVLGKAPAVTEVESDESSDESSEDEQPAKITKAAAKADSSDESEEDSESSDDNDSAAEEPAAVNKDDSDDSDGSDDSSESEAEVKPKVTKRKAEMEAEPAAKKSKTDESAAAPQSANLFVGNLSWNVDEAWLKETFEEHGEIARVQLMTDRATGRSKGFGYVEFVNAEDAAAAHAAKQGAELDNRAMNVDFANARQKTDQADRRKSYGDQVSDPSDTLFLGNLSFDCGQETVTEAFSPHGTILGIRLPTDRETGQPKGFGYVTFSSVDEASAALEVMQGSYIAGRPVRLDYSQPRPQNGDSPARGRGGFGDRGGRGGGRGRGGFGDRGGRGGGRGRGGFDRGRGGRGGSTNRGGFGDFSGKKVSFD